MFEIEDGAIGFGIVVHVLIILVYVCLIMLAAALS